MKFKVQISKRVTLTVLSIIVMALSTAIEELLSSQLSKSSMLNVNTTARIPTNKMDRQTSINRIIKKCKNLGLGKEQCSYVLATTEHETNNTFLPVVEAYWLSDKWRSSNLRYYPWFGRGFVQITWKSNYELYSRLLNVDLVSNPDLALEYDNALFILVDGIKNGRFTGRRVGHYISTDGKNVDYVNARRVVNGMDKAHHIAKLARNWEYDSRVVDAYAVNKDIVDTRGKLITIPGKSKPVGINEPIDGVTSFTWGEATKNGTRIPPNWKVTKKIIDVAQELQKIRDHYGVPIKVISWYRTPSHDRSIGGAGNHPRGDSVDFVVIGVSNQSVYNYLNPRHNGGLGLYNGHLHIDLNGRRRWSGKSV